MSDATEKNDTNSLVGRDLHYWVADPDPSRAAGYHEDATGHLINGLNLTNSSGPCGYKHYLGTDSPDSDDWGTAKLLRVIEDVAQAWSLARSYRFGCGDMSKQSGGLFLPHVGHRNGIEVDVRYIRDDHAEESRSLDPNDPYLRYGPLDTLAAVHLVRLFESHSWVTDIIVDYRFPIEPSTKIRLDFPPTAHDDHFHVRIHDPDGPDN
jgi:murein endopeptidase